MSAGVTKAVFKKFIKYYDPDVFIAAGRKIRAEACNADSLPPLERILKITALFSCFKNPEKETVLIPWRVVNMHMNDCLGGYDFYDEAHTERLDVPRFVDHGDATAESFGIPMRLFWKSTPKPACIRCMLLTVFSVPNVSLSSRMN